MKQSTGNRPSGDSIGTLTFLSVNNIIECTLNAHNNNNNSFRQDADYLFGYLFK